MSVLASAAAAAQDVNVKIIDDGRGGLSLRDFVIPIGALLAGVAGVLIGGRIQQRIETRRSDREEALDDRRAQRERDLEDERQRRADNASKRQAIGSIRVVRSWMFDIYHQAGVALEREAKWVMHEGLSSPVRPEDEHLLASWLKSGAWRQYLFAKDALDALLLWDDKAAAVDARWDSRIRRVRGCAAIAINRLVGEEARLADEIGDPEPLADWVPLREDPGYLVEHAPSSAADHA